MCTALSAVPRRAQHLRVVVLGPPMAWIKSFHGPHLVNSLKPLPYNIPWSVMFINVCSIWEQLPKLLGKGISPFLTPLPEILQSGMRI